MSKKPEECKNSSKNPTCPYITQINQYGKDIQDIKDALIGKDMQSGIVKKVADLSSEFKSSQDTQRSWNNFIKPIAIGIITAVIVTVLTKIPW